MGVSRTLVLPILMTKDIDALTGECDKDAEDAREEEEGAEECKPPDTWRIKRTLDWSASSTRFVLELKGTRDTDDDNDGGDRCVTVSPLNSPLRRILCDQCAFELSRGVNAVKFTLSRDDETKGDDDDDDKDGGRVSRDLWLLVAVGTLESIGS